VFVQVNRDNQVNDFEADLNRIEEMVGSRLGRLNGKVTAAEVHLAHVKESRTNNPEYRCSIEVRPENLGPVAASAEGVGVEAVVRSACDKVLHAYDKVVGKQRAR
jgi:Ni,Fe-hydrogenase I large subunit